MGASTVNLNYPIRHHHRLGVLRSTALVAAAGSVAALTATLAARRWSRRAAHPRRAQVSNRSIEQHDDTGTEDVPPRNRTTPWPSGRPSGSTSGFLAAVAAVAAATGAVVWLRRPAGGGRAPIGFAVVDTETTGLDQALDRVIEVAVVHADGLGNLTDTFSWRTRPDDGRHGAEHVHHISQADLASAPTFAQVTDRLNRALDGRTLVAHNAPFDTRFLAAEYRRAGRPVHPALLRPLCTVELASRLGMAPLRLSAVARALGSPQPATAHRATDDAVATAQLLTPLLNRAGIARAGELPLVDGTRPRDAPQRRRPPGRHGSDRPTRGARAVSRAGR
ncbi:MAG: 3'-5' exonuclease [Microthrixaceae bacterium]|nr:3'-5' exonuclease [Microthrixaceae bacterium]